MSRKKIIDAPTRYHGRWPRWDSLLIFVAAIKVSQKSYPKSPPDTPESKVWTTISAVVRKAMEDHSRVVRYGGPGVLRSLEDCKYVTKEDH